MSLKYISVEIKNILAGKPGKRGEARIESILGSEISQDIDPDTYFNLSPENKIEVLTSLYFRIINNFDGKRINELVFISEVLSQCGFEVGVDGIKKLGEFIRNSKRPVSVSEGIVEAKKYAKTSVEQKFVMKGVEFQSSGILPYKFEEKVPMGVNFENNFGPLSNFKNLSEILSHIGGNLRIVNKNSNLQMFQDPTDCEDDFFYMEVNSFQLSSGDYFFINRIVFLTIENISGSQITVTTKNSAQEKRENSFNTDFSIGSTQSDQIYYPNLIGSSTRIYKDSYKWYICNDTASHPLMLAFHNKNNSTILSRRLGISAGESKKVMIAGNVFQFTVERNLG